MFDDIAALFYNHVIPAYLDYRAEKESGRSGRNRDMRAAIDAATALYHFREHLPAAHSISRAKMAKRCPDYDLVGDIVNAAKHKKLTMGQPQLTSVDAFTEEVVITEFKDQEGTYTDVEKTITIKLDDGTSRDMLEVFTATINCWMDYLEAASIIPQTNRFVLTPRRLPILREEANSRLDLEIVQGLRFKQEIRLQRYNYETGTVGPVDLTDTTIRARIYKPTYDLDLTFTNNKTGDTTTTSIALSDQEQTRLTEASDERAREAIIAQIVQDRGGPQELLAKARAQAIGNEEG